MKNWIFVLLTGWVFLAQAEPFGDDELLQADKAFAMQATMASEDRIRAVWTIADGYYMYRDKFRFDTETPGIRLGDPVFPPGKVKNDEFFGEIETYRHQVAVEIPVIKDAGAPDKFALKTTSQGCADIGVCYPPHTQTASLELTGLPATTTAGKTGGALKALSDLGASFGSSGEDELLPADQAFQPEIEVTDANTLTASWMIADGYYLYRHKFDFAIEPSDAVTLLPAEIPRYITGKPTPPSRCNVPQRKRRR
jgi:thiol:disulfide interchange protein DsbD